MLIPSIDLMNGKAVQLIGGKKKELEEKNVYDLAKKFSRLGDIAVIDLDAALGKCQNERIIEKLCSKYNCRVGGGIRSKEKAMRILNFGAKKIIIGTKADKKFLKELPKSRIIVAIDSKENKVLANGWKTKTSKSPKEKIKELKNYCTGFLFTDVSKEGKLEGANIKKAAELRKATPQKMDFTYAGGISTIEEIAELNKLNINAQIGMAIYKNKIKLADAFISCLKFNNGLIPTIVKNENQVLMLAYSNKDSIKKSLETGKATYFSRSRNTLWRKGETSGNFQTLQRTYFDCDSDALLFDVTQKNNACHLEQFSCFGGKEFSLQSLYEKLQNRKEFDEKKSFTKKLF